MDKVARLEAAQRQELFRETAARRGMTPAIVEKDFWVSWMLGQIYQHEDLSRLLMFKGGTSLSKVYGLIERFSEDIDLVLDWRIVTSEEPEAERSKKKQKALNEEMRERAREYIADVLLAMLQDVSKGVCECTIDEEDAQVINVQYPASFPDEYLRPEVRLEIGPLAAWLPYEEKVISCYAAEEFPDVFDQTEYSVQVIKAERTFWDKVTILHHEAHRPEDNLQPPRYSRHYYDLYKMMHSDIKRLALDSMALLEDVVAFKQRFYPRGWAKYEEAVPGSLKLLPEAHVLETIRKDYEAMKNMLFGEVPNIDDIMAALGELQQEINRER